MNRSPGRSIKEDKLILIKEMVNLSDVKRWHISLGLEFLEIYYPLQRVRVSSHLMYLSTLRIIATTDISEFTINVTCGQL